MKNKIIIIGIVLVLIILFVVGYILGYKMYQQWRIANAIVIVELNDNLEVDVFCDVKLSSFIKSINGKLVDDFTINTFLSLIYYIILCLFLLMYVNVILHM